MSVAVRAEKTLHLPHGDFDLGILIIQACGFHQSFSPNPLYRDAGQGRRVH